jgi:hypothetical protein
MDYTCTKEEKIVIIGEMAGTNQIGNSQFDLLLAHNIIAVLWHLSMSMNYC